MWFINHKNNFYFRINIQEPLDKERVRDFILFTFIISKTRTVIESGTINNDLVWYRSLWILFMTNFNVWVIWAIKSRFKSIISHKELCSREEGQYCTFPNSSITNYNDCLISIWIFRNTADSIMDHVFEFC